MSLIENYAAERKARLVRLGSRPKPTPKFEPIDPAPFYPQMWMYDLVEPSAAKQPPSVLSIRDAVCKYFKVLPIDIESHRQQPSITYPRQIGYYLARIHTPYSYPQIGRRFGGRDHATIIHGVKKIQFRMKTEPAVAHDISSLEAML